MTKLQDLQTGKEALNNARETLMSAIAATEYLGVHNLLSIAISGIDRATGELVHSLEAEQRAAEYDPDQYKIQPTS